VLGEANRLRILCELGLECRPVTDVINATSLGLTNVSFHLREAEFVRAERSRIVHLLLSCRPRVAAYPARPQV